MRLQNHSTRSFAGFTLVELLVVLSIALALVSIGWPYWWEAPQRARTRESHWGLRQVQVAIERYGVDAGGHYPEFLYGGDFSDDYASTSADVQSAWPGDVDVLLEHGYLGSYPRNPFVSPTQRGHQQWTPRDWQLVVDPGRLGWYADGGDRALVLASRRVGGTRGTTMVDVSEGQRHAPPIWSLPIRRPDNRYLRIATPWRQLMTGNFNYFAIYPAGGGARWSPELAARDPRVPARRPRPVSYVLWSYGPASLWGRDIHTEAGIPLDPELAPGPLWQPHGPDGNPDGVSLVLRRGSAGTDADF
ncbi:MAG: hypothetical protein GEEBNDBF_01832 [bacterium]|nr:hypothetical protein [bacterium]